MQGLWEGSCCVVTGFSLNWPSRFNFPLKIRSKARVAGPGHYLQPQDARSWLRCLVLGLGGWGKSQGLVLSLAGLQGYSGGLAPALETSRT